MTSLPNRPDFSAASSFSPFSSSGPSGPSGPSGDRIADGDELTRFERESLFVPQITVGFGACKYGPQPEDIAGVVNGASGGEGVVQRLVHRRDLDPVYRYDSRGPDIVFREGFPPAHDLRAGGFPYDFAQFTSAELVSATRNRDPEDEAGLPAGVFDETGLTYRYALDAPGGYEFLPGPGSGPGPGPRPVASRGHVAFWKGVRPEFVSQVSAFDGEGTRRWTRESPHAHAAREVRAERAYRDERTRRRKEAQRLPGHGSTAPGPASSTPTSSTPDAPRARDPLPGAA